MANEYPVPSSNAETVAIVTAVGQSVFNYDFIIYRPTQIRVIVRRDNGDEIELDYQSQFTVSGAGNPNGGSVNFIGVDTYVNDEVYIWRDTIIDREKNWQNEGDYKADLVNAEQNDIYMIMQELDRGIKKGDAATEKLGTEVVLLPDGHYGPQKLPVPSPGRVIGYGSDGSFQSLINSAADAEVIAVEVRELRQEVSEDKQVTEEARADAGAFADAASTQADRSEAAANIAVANLPYQTYSEGLAATTDGGFFAVIDADTMRQWVYKRINGAGVLQSGIPYLNNQLNAVAALIGSPSVVGELPNAPLVDFDAVDAATGTFRFRNRAKGTPKGESALSWGFANGVYAPALSTLYGATITEGEPDTLGGNTAFRVQAPATPSGNFPQASSGIRDLPPGQYTVAFTVRSSSGTQAFAWGHSNLSGSGFTWEAEPDITPTPVDIIKTFEITEKRNISFFWGMNAASTPTAAFDAVIEGMRIVPGASAGPRSEINADIVSNRLAQPLVKDMVLENYGNDSRNSLAMQLPEITSFDEMSFVACINWDGQTSGVAAVLFSAAGGSDPTTTNAFHFGMPNDHDTLLINIPGGVFSPKPLVNPYKAGWCTVGFSISGDERKVFFNGRLSAHSNNGFSGAMMQAMRFLGQTGTNFPVSGQTSGFLLYDRALSDGDMKEASDVLKARVMMKGFPFYENDNFYISEGDSITSSYNYGYNVQMGKHFTPRMLGRNLAVSGSNMASLNGRKAAAIAAINEAQSEGKNVIFSVFIGANNSFNSNQDADDYYTGLLGYWADIKATGAKLIVCTLIPKSVLATMDYIERINNHIRNDPSKYDGLADFQANPAFATYDAAYFLDGLHPNQAGQDIMAGVMLPVIQSLVE